MATRRTFLQSCAAAAWGGPARGNDAMDVGLRRQLFFDHRFIAAERGIRLEMHPPRKAGPVLLPERPWERDYIGSYLSVIEHEGVLKMWYMCAGGKGGGRLCYATSVDGIHWDRPALGVAEFEGSRENNIVLANFREGAVMLDPVAAPEQRFKTLASFGGKRPSALGTLHNGSLTLVTSPDGIHWKQEFDVLPFHPDSMNVLLWDPRRQAYAAYLRGWNPLRVVVRDEIPRDRILGNWPYAPNSNPFYLWSFLKDKWPPAIRSELPTVIAADRLDPADSDIYTPNVQVYPWADDAYVAFPTIFHHTAPPGKERVPMAGLLDVQFASSRDGVHFDRSDRRPYVRLGMTGEPDSRGVYMGLGMIARGGEMFQYYGGSAADHGSRERAASAILRAVQRLDGFVFAGAGPEGGELVTPPLRFEGSRLCLNIDTSAAGEAAVELRGADGNAISGFALAECRTIIDNSTAHEVTWKAGGDLGRLRGQPVRLRISLRNARLYAFQFREANA